jgi:hypothetical protein
MLSFGTRALAGVLLAFGAVAWAPQTRDWILSREITGRVDVFSYFPLQVGNRWVYQYEYKTGDPERPNVQRWTSEVVVAEHVRVPEGLVVVRRVGTGAPANVADLERFHYLVRGNYVYEVHETSWDARNRSLGEGLRSLLAKGDATPDFFFPMRAGLLWAEKQREDEDYRKWLEAQKQGGHPYRPDHFYHWAVEGRGAVKDIRLPVSPRAFALAYYTAGGPAWRSFEEGVGVVGEWNHHSGTYWDTTVRLLKFTPAPPPSKR